MKRVLITGKHSYIGTSFESWAAAHHASDIATETISLRGTDWRGRSFAGFDSVFHVAGIAHADSGHETDEEKARYFAVNRDLAIETAAKAKSDGVKQFVLMSSMLVYGNVAYAGRVNKNTTPTPTTCYALSKWQADEKIRELADDGFAVATLRPPMIYGKGCKGNYPLLSKIARHAPIFPDYDNERSMLFIENLCEFVSQVIIRSKRGVFFPQNSEYVKTSDMVRAIAQASGHKIFISRLFNFLVPLGKSVKFFRIAERTNKAFASMSYEKNLSDYEFEYRVADFETSINMIEREK